MKQIQLLAVLLSFSAATHAQTSMAYHDEGFDTKKVEKMYAIETPGQQFTNRMNTLYKGSDSGHITQNRYNSFIQKFDALASTYTTSNASIPTKLKIFATILNDLNNVAYNIDGNRDEIYHIVSPVYKAATEGWGDEVVNTALANAYFLLREHVTYLTNDVKLKKAVPVVARNPINFGDGMTPCEYTVQVGQQLGKDKVDIFYTHLGLFSKAAKKYPADRLLAGPVVGWENYKDESESIMDMLKTYADMGDNSSMYVRVQNPDKPTGKYNKVTSELNSDMKWFVWVFRNGKLYYSYMAEPCSRVNRIQVN